MEVTAHLLVDIFIKVLDELKNSGAAEFLWCRFELMVSNHDTLNAQAAACHRAFAKHVPFECVVSQDFQNCFVFELTENRVLISVKGERCSRYEKLIETLQKTIDIYLKVGAE